MKAKGFTSYKGETGCLLVSLEEQKTTIRTSSRQCCKRGSKSPGCMTVGIRSTHMQREHVLMCCAHPIQTPSHLCRRYGWSFEQVKM